MKKAQSVLFDLDGTLLDTAPDLVGALNATLVKHGRPVVSLESARPYVSRGARGLLQRGFGLEPESEGYQSYVEEFLECYRQSLCDKSSLFEGMAELLDALDARRCMWGVTCRLAETLRSMGCSQWMARALSART